MDDVTRDLLRRVADLETQVADANRRTAIPVVTALGDPGHIGRLVVLSTDGKLYRDTGAAWKSSDQA